MAKELLALNFLDIIFSCPVQDQRSRAMPLFKVKCNVQNPEMSVEE